jgi:predicted anti-sigma-YlaC factor YlaD
MKNEMDIVDMDERQRLAWLRANRLTLICVGIVWIGMIVRELLSGGAPYFMIVMVPVFALLRFLLYRRFVGIR